MNTFIIRYFGASFSWIYLCTLLSISSCYLRTDPSTLKCDPAKGCPNGYECRKLDGEPLGICCKMGDKTCGINPDAGTKKDVFSSFNSHITTDDTLRTDVPRTIGGTTISTDGKGLTTDGTIIPRDGNAIADVQPVPDAPQAQPDGGFPTPPPPQDPAKAKNGDVCAVDGDCQFGHCVDQVCCDKNCKDACYSCKKSLTGKADGECAAVSSGKKDTTNSCIDETAKNECGNDGFCDGDGACRKVGTDHVCSPSACSGDNASTFTPTITCDGIGACKTVVPTNCGTAGCDKVDGCRKICTDSTHCTANAFCNVEVGKCTEKKIDGESCKIADECQSKICVDGVCCRTACTEKCKACALALTGQKSGTCLPVKLGSDPHDSCPDEPGCGGDGTCDGAGDCLKRGADTICSPALCSSDNKFSFPAGCNGKGVCQTPKVQDCQGITCDPKVGCPSKCTIDTNCESGNYCNDGTCTPKLGPGKPCTTTNECASGNCVEGVCCNEKCDAACYSCKKNLNGKPADGTCAVVVSGQKDTRNSCDDTRDSTQGCGQDGTCDGNGGCQKVGKGTNCEPATCNAGGDFVATSTCNGSGLCVTPSAEDCGAYPCATTGCQKSCTTDQDCSGSTFCAKPYCVAKLGPGGACGSNNNACDLGNCVSGVCCRTTCPVVSSKPCGFNGKCDTSGYCTNAETGIQCDGPKCSVNSFSPASSCNGSGSCIDHFVPCDKFKCSTAGCNQSCSGDSDCNGVRCSNNNLCEDCSGLNQPCCKTATACEAGLVCDGVKCVIPKLPKGQPCDTGSQCESKFCTDGVCCGSLSCVTCQSCNFNGSGTCSNVPAGLEDDTCKKGTCTTGCDGRGLCAIKQVGTCVNYNTRKYCESAVTEKTIDCPYGCLNGDCRNSTYATVGRSGEVTCFGLKCVISPEGLGCGLDDIKGLFCGRPNGDGSFDITCDGPNDCTSNQICCYHYNTVSSEVWTICTPLSSCSIAGNVTVAEIVCDPLAPICPSGSCKEVGAGRLGDSVYTCR